MFDPALAGYWGAIDLDAATRDLPGRARANATKIDGIKVSLLDEEREIACARGCRVECACTPATTSTIPS